MSSTTHLRRGPTEWLVDSLLAPYVAAFTRYLSERRYATQTIDTKLGCIAHFGRWMSQCRLDVHRIDEEAVRGCLDDHLPRCDCAAPVARTRRELRPALRNLLVVLRAEAVIGGPLPGRTGPVEEELRCFDEHMDHVRGLAPKTRALYLRTVRRLLVEQAGDRPVVISAITPEDVRQFVASQSKLYSTPSSAGSRISALRGYFRFRAACGDQVHGLIGVVSYPANWQLASLPKTLNSAEVEHLTASLGGEGPSARRTDAMVRCALDLGLRCGEIATLAMEDIDWRAGTITLRKTKSRRQDILPLPETTGRAIVEYLKHERPPTDRRAVFVRHIAPCDQPIGPDTVRKAIRQAYARAGLPHTRAHLLRHYLASRTM
jgi:integrase/recombinase XerC